MDSELLYTVNSQNSGHGRYFGSWPELSLIRAENCNFTPARYFEILRYDIELLVYMLAKSQITIVLDLFAQIQIHLKLISQKLY